MVSPFGTIYGTNITPSKENGIGLYSDDELLRSAAPKASAAMARTCIRRCRTPRITWMPRADSDAIHAYLKTVEPIERAAPSPA